VAVILANQKKWNALPEELRDAIIEFKRGTVDPAVAEYYEKLSAESWDTLMGSGVEPIQFPEPQGKQFLETAYDAAWEHVSSKSPELGPKLKEMLVK
jgi:TRAP-type C4-dicarboxylate transport system substrate-binding protein